MILQCSYIKACECDILFELGALKNTEGDLHLIAATFLSNHGLEKFNDTNYESLYNYKSILVHAGKQRFEAYRSGESQGMCSKDSAAYRKHVHQPGSWPRKSSAVRKIIVCSTNQCGYYGIYLCTTVPRTAYWFYNTPQTGGHQKLKPKQVEDFPLLASFPDCRIIKPDENSNVIKDFSCVGYHLAMNASHTLVTHAVGFHRDIFSSGQAEIKSKLLMVSFDRSDLSETIARGRGGGGPGFFVYAILDWGNETKHHRQQYLELGGSATVRYQPTVLGIRQADTVPVAP
eukprot:scaffold95216_cov68-Attheya_sp.AAC.10